MDGALPVKARGTRNRKVHARAVGATGAGLNNHTKGIVGARAHTAHLHGDEGITT